MPINTVIKGDIIKQATQGLYPRYTHLVHGCNCWNGIAEGSGLAPQMAVAFPKCDEVDKKTIAGDKEKLGTFSVAWVMDDQLCIINAYTQFNGGRNVDYEAIAKVFITLNDNAVRARKADNFVYGIPMIGAGVAGGDWHLIKEIINLSTPDLDIELIMYDPSL